MPFCPVFVVRRFVPLCIEGAYAGQCRAIKWATRFRILKPRCKLLDLLTRALHLPNKNEFVRKTWILEFKKIRSRFPLFDLGFYTANFPDVDFNEVSPVRTLFRDPARDA